MLVLLTIEPKQNSNPTTYQIRGRKRESNYIYRDRDPTTYQIRERKREVKGVNVGSDWVFGTFVKVCGLKFFFFEANVYKTMSEELSSLCLLT